MNYTTDDDNIKFDTDTQFSKIPQKTKQQDLITYLVNKGLVRNKKQAQYMIITLILVVIVVVTLIMIVGSKPSPIIESSTEEEIYYDGPNTLLSN